jgi:hypothetical protein
MVYLTAQFGHDKFHLISCLTYVQFVLSATTASSFNILCFFFFHWLYSPLGPWSLFFGFMIILQTVGLLGRVITSWQGLYLNTGQHKHRINTYTHQTCMPCVGFEPMIPASEREKTVHALDRSATVTGQCIVYRGTSIPPKTCLSLHGMYKKPRCRHVLVRMYVRKCVCIQLRVYVCVCTQTDLLKQLTYCENIHLTIPLICIV